MKTLQTWQDLKELCNTLTPEQLQWGLCINVADGDAEGEFYGVSNDGLPKVLFVSAPHDAPLDEDEPYLRLEI
jgi:hypothetical protein